MDIRENFQRTVSALKNRFDDQSEHLCSCSFAAKNKVLTQSVDNYCFSLEKLFLRLNINDDFINCCYL